MTSKARERELARQRAKRQAAREEAERQRRQRYLKIGAAVVVVLVAVAGLFVWAPWEDSGSESDVVAGSGGDGSTVDCVYEPSGEAARDVGTPPTEDIPASGTVSTTLEMGQGSVPLELDRAQGPCAVNNFLHLASSGYYDDTICHRLTDSTNLSVLQCGDPTGTGTGGPGYTFADEVTDDLRYFRSTVAMANAGPDTNGSQFFLVYNDSLLPPSFTVFGQVTDEGLEVVDGIAAAGVAGGGEDGAPAEEVRISEAAVAG